MRRLRILGLRVTGLPSGARWRPPARDQAWGRAMISYQLYCSRDFGPLPDTLAMLKEAGYGAVEGWSGLVRDADTARGTAAALDAAGLPMTSVHAGLAALEADHATLVPILRDLGCESVFVPAVPPDDRPADRAGWDSLRRRIEAAGEPVRAANLAFGWHNHDFELADMGGGETALDVLLSGDLAWEADVAWLVRGGADPMPFIDRHAARIRAVHVKDIAPEGMKADEDGWADPGTGTMDWDALAARLAETGVAHWVMEHDAPSDDSRFAHAAIGMARRTAGIPA